MTEAIKQLIAYQAKFWLSKFSHSSGKRVGYIMGLTKGIEIAEGFAEWVEKFSLPGKEGFWLLQGEDGVLTTSQLLEKYLETLNKEKA